MHKVRLETTSGELVGDFRIPPFRPAPEVIIWGARVFQKATTGEKPEIYREAFSYWLPPDDLTA
jgi:hypothetical protein